MQAISIREARRLAFTRAGLLKPEWTGLPQRAAGRGQRARRAAQRIIQRFGYLQLDTVSIAGARSHTIVLLSRLAGFDPALGEKLLQPGEPIFEYWGHEASWLPIELYPVMDFRRRRFRTHPWWGDLVGQNPKVAENLRRRIRDEGPLRSVDMEGKEGRGWWDLKIAKRVASALWCSGEFAIRERRNFHRTYDLAERVIPEEWREETVPQPAAFEHLLLRALKGHGWATTGTLAQTWRLRNCRSEIKAALDRLTQKGTIIPCDLVRDDNRRIAGWVRPDDLALAARLARVRPRSDRGVLLSPFDPVLWDRTRVALLFGFNQVLEVFKPASKRVYGYYCLPVLAGERLIARFDLKADKKSGRLNVLSCRFENQDGPRSITATDRRAARSALIRYAEALSMKVRGWRMGRAS